MTSDGDGAGERRGIPAATEAALWALSNGTCYAPGCAMPVVVEVSCGVYKKNVQVAHIYGVRPNAPRYRADLDAERRDRFGHLILLCIPHHSVVDDRVTGESKYPADLLLKWKKKHEGQDYDRLRNVTFAGGLDNVGAYLERVFQPPVKRLEALADRLQETGELNEKSLLELKRIVRLMSESPTNVDARTASTLAQAADVLSVLSLKKTAQDLLNAADMLAHLPRRGPER
jgi:hypothetical protein